MTSRPIVILSTVVLGAMVGLGIAVLTQDFDPPASASGDKVTQDKVPAAARTPAQTFDPRFQSCAHCHQVGPDARKSSGPVLTGVLGRKAATTDYPYSQAMRDSEIVWDEATLRAFVKSPQRVVPGTRMAFGGLDDEKIDALIDFLKSNPQ